MFAFFRQLGQRWSDWCGDHEMENAIRQHLSLNGYYGGTAKLRQVRLAAVKRPGWMQVFRFEVTARLAVADDDSDALGEGLAASLDPNGREVPTYHELFGLVREDQRSGQVDIRVFRSGDQRRELFARWSDGLLQLRGGRSMTTT
jgi:hypothetical protein